MKELKDLNKQQLDAFDNIMKSLINDGQKGFVLSGVSGSGKTMLISKIAKILNEQGFPVFLGALTGKAVSNVRNRLSGVIKPHLVQTLHTLFMEVYYEEDDKKQEFPKFRFLEKQEVNTIYKDSIIIIDEASMVPQFIFDWLLEQDSFSILFVGDKEQLGPVSNDNLNIMDYYDYHMNKIERTNNQIVNLSKDVRERGVIDKRFNKFNEISIYNSYFPTMNWLEKNYDSFDIIICGTNRVREQINQMIREIHGYQDTIPEEGETILCRKNITESKKGKKMYNGELYKVVERRALSHEDYEYKVNPIEESDKLDIFYFKLNIWTWNQKNPYHVLNKRDVQEKAFHNNCFDFGYCITCHSSQGSQWNNVLFVDEDVSYFLNQKRFRYTGITRAVNKVQIFT